MRPVQILAVFAEAFELLDPQHRQVKKNTKYRPSLQNLGNPVNLTNPINPKSLPSGPKPRSDEASALHRLAKHCSLQARLGQGLRV